MQLLFPLMLLMVVVGISTAFPEKSDKSHLEVEGDHLPDPQIKFPEGELGKPKPEEGREGKAIVMAAGRIPPGGGYGGYGGYGYRGYGGYGYGYPGYYGGYRGYYGYPSYYGGYYRYPGYPYYG